MCVCVLSFFRLRIPMLIIGSNIMTKKSRFFMAIKSAIMQRWKGSSRAKYEYNKATYKYALTISLTAVVCI